MEGKPRFNTKRFEAFKGATGGYNINIFSPGVRSSLMSKTVNYYKIKQVSITITNKLKK